MENKRKRGRPSTGKALTAAQKQKAYRERQKLNTKTLLVTTNSQEEKELKSQKKINESLTKEIEELRNKLRIAERSFLDAHNQIQRANKEIVELTQENVKLHKSKRNRS